MADHQIPLRQLPLAALMRYLEQRFTPDADTFLLPGSVGMDSLDAVTGFGAVVTSLPSSPVDGQHCYYLADATNGIVWHLRYRAASASSFKWEVVGEAPALYKLVGNVFPPDGGVESKSGVSSNIYGALTTPLSLTLPLAGDYDIDHGFFGNSVASVYAIQSLSFGGGTPSDLDAVTAFDASGAMIPVSRSLRKTGLSATTVAAQYRTYASGQSMGVNNRWIRCTPVRVG